MVADRKLLLAAAERHLPELRVKRAEALLGSDLAGLALDGARLAWEGEPIARLEPGRSVLVPRVVLDQALDSLPAELRKRIVAAFEVWLARAMAALAPLRRLDAATGDAACGPELRALLIRLVEAGGLLERAPSGLDRLSPDQRDRLRKLGEDVTETLEVVPRQWISLSLCTPMSVFDSLENVIFACLRNGIGQKQFKALPALTITGRELTGAILP